MNACSLESLQKPIRTINGLVWPVITSCYNLEGDGSRIGHLDLFLVGVPENDSDPLAFGEPHLSFGCRSGILDGKWFPKNASDNEGWWFATAQSSGDIGLHTLRDNDASFPVHTRRRVHGGLNSLVRRRGWIWMHFVSSYTYCRLIKQF